MHVEFLVEEESVEVALHSLVPKILGTDVTFQIHTFQGKQDLLGKLESRLKGYKNWLPSDWRIVVLIDEDRQTCKKLKRQLEEAARRAGLTTKSSVTTGEKFQVLNRIAIEELEAWFFGDVPAMVKAYPGVPSTLNQKAKFRNPDAIKGGTWEALERVLQKAGYHQGGLNKIAAARDISPHLCPQRNRSKSFKVFRGGLLQL
jgi:hypothetical protein